LKDEAIVDSQGERIATFLFYVSQRCILLMDSYHWCKIYIPQLENVKFGGATAFPFLGISAQPVKGSAIFWYLSKRNGKEDKAFIHAGCIFKLS